MSPFLQAMFREFSTIAEGYMADRRKIDELRSEIAVRGNIIAAYRKEFKRLGVDEP